MGNRITNLISQTLLVGAGIAAYHFAVATDRSTPAPVEPSGGTPKSVAAAPPGGAVPGLPPLAIPPSFVRFEAVERRLAMVERALANASALASTLPPASGGGTTEGSPIPKGSSVVWTEDQLTGLRSMISEIEMRKRQEDYASAMRATLRQAGKEPLAPEIEERALALLVAFQRRIWELFPGGTAGPTSAERAAANAAAQRGREALDEELRRILPADQADGILSRVQTFFSPPQPDHINVPGESGGR